MTFIPSDKPDHSSSPALDQWRERSLNWVLRAILIFWLPGIILGLYTIWQVSRQNNLAELTAVLFLFYLVITAVLLLATFTRSWTYQRRVFLFLLALYVFGLADLILRGYSGDGRVFLLAFVVMATIFVDLRRSIYALAVGTVTLLTVALLQLTGLITAPPLNILATTPSALGWLNSLVIFVGLGITAVFSIALIIRSLDNSLTQAHQEQAFANAILNTSGALIVVFDQQGRIARFNRACEEATGYSAAEMVGQHVWDHLLTPDGGDLLKLVFAQLQTNHQPAAYDSYWLTRAGERRLIAWTSSLLTGATNGNEYIISAGIDITSQKQTEVEKGRLLAAEREQRLLSDTLAEAMLSITSQINPEDVLDQILRQVQRIVPFRAAHIMLLTGDTLQVARWQGYHDLGGEKHISRLVQSLSTLPLEREVVALRQPIVINDTRQETGWVVYAETAWVRAHLVVPILQQEQVLGLLRLDSDTPGAFSHADAERLQNLATTIAIALQNARLLQETQQKARQVRRILNTVQDGILLLDADFRVELANPAAQAHLELLSDTPEGLPLRLLGGRPVRELVKPPLSPALWHEIKLQKPPQTFEAVAQPMETQVGGWVLVLRDTTEARKQQQYVQAQERLAMVGQMTAGIAHDFNNIMTVIILYAQMLLQAPTLPAELAARLETVFTQSKLAANLISQILDFSRHADMQRRPIHLIPFLKELVKLLRRTLPEHIDLRLDYDERSYLISADMTRMQQVVMNLVVNARDAMPQGGTLRLDLAHIMVDEEEKRPLPDLPLGEWIRLQVSDTGVGIPPENLTRIFEPLFTTKERGRGTGLGLAQVHGIVKQHGGFLDVTSVVGEGTTMSLFFPALAEASTQPEKETISPTLQGQGETILVVEDDQITREAICAILETFNYLTIEAADAEEALRLFSFFSDKIALVLSDLVMPGMTGAALHNQLRREKPDINTIIISGYPFTEEDRASLSPGIVAWIQKPFEVEDIVLAIHEGLAAAA